MTTAGTPANNPNMDSTSTIPDKSPPPLLVLVDEVVVSAVMLKSILRSSELPTVSDAVMKRL